MCVKQAKNLCKGDVIYIHPKQAVRVVERVSLGYSNTVFVDVTESIPSVSGNSSFTTLSYCSHDQLIPVIAQSEVYRGTNRT